MINLNSAKSIITNTIGRTGLVLSKYSPEILMGIGIAGVITSTVLACKATLKVDSVMEVAKSDFAKIHRAKENLPTEEYSDEDYKQDLAIAYTQRIVSIGRLYAPAVGVGVVAIGCLVGSHTILSRRNVALIAAYKLIDESYSNYRSRVVKELGSEKDRMFRHNLSEVANSEIVDETSPKTKIVETNPGRHFESDYAQYFEDTNLNWQSTPYYNEFFLKSQQNYANDKLKSRGHLFLNEVYDMLGFKRLFPAGQIVGWVWNHKDEKDGFVDFGLNNMYLYSADGKIDNTCYLLDFNVDGIIYDLI
jgi:hypothetical protein